MITNDIYMENNIFRNDKFDCLNSDYIPIRIIDDLIMSSYPSSIIVHSYNFCHKIVKVKIIDLLNAPVKNWEYNRKPDPLRCPEIAKYIYSTKKTVDCMLYMSFNNKEKCFDMIDGIHRYTALKIIQLENSKPNDFLTPGDFGNDNNANWLYDAHIFLNIRFNPTQGELFDLFKSLNKSCPVADIYIRDFAKEKREIIENIVNNWQIKYKTHFTLNNKPNRPNINRNTFIELVEKLYDKHSINDENKDLLENILQELNQKISSRVHKNISQQIINKCISSGCWIFLYPNDKLISIT
jgi:hypothetical protein